MNKQQSDGRSAAIGRGGARVAFFGGSFDPPHLGHLAVARAACAALRLDQVLFAPVGAQPLKPEGPTASFADRVAMTRLAIAGEPGFAISLADAPKPNGAPNYTAETLESLQADLGAGAALFCLMGADSFFELRRWHRAPEIPFIAPLIVASRPAELPEEDLGGLRAALPQGLTLVNMDADERLESGVAVREFQLMNPAGGRAPFYLLPGLDVEISASEIRSLSHNLQQPAGPRPAMLPAAVAEYVQTHGLYR